MTQFNFKKWNTVTGWAVFAIAFIVYCLTVERTMSFWDCGEYITTAAKLEVGHPPGAPLFQMAGAFLAMFAPGPEYVALMVNMLSVLSGTFTILFMFWSLTILLKNLVAANNNNELSANNAVMVLGSAAVASLAFTFTDSFWFNATEAEVYSMASLFIALLLWAGLRWGEEMHQPRGNRWLLIISLLIGLSFGVHFMALLTIPSIGVIYYFKNYRQVTVKNFIIANIVIVAVLFFVFKFLLPYTLALFGKTEIFMVNTLGLPFDSGTVFTALAITAFFYFGLRYTKRRQLHIYNTALLSLLFILIGFSTWMMLPIRANANVPINENRPSDAAEVLAYYNREQYGEQKTFFGPSYTEAYAGIDKENPYRDSKPNYERDYKTGKYVVVNNYKNARQNPDSRHSGFLPRMGSDKEGHAVNYMSFVGPPEFRMDPAHDFTGDLAQYGVDVNSISEEQAMQAAAQMRGELEKIVAEFRAGYKRGELGFEEYDKFLKEYGEFLIVEKPSFGQNIQFMAEYQFGYMFWRYLMWNFTGRQDDIQGEYNNHGNWISGITFIDEARLGPQTHLTTDMKNNKARNTYYFLPFILAVVGIAYHAKKDIKSFYVLLVLFLFTGIALKIFLNESPFEVRERDYAVVGAFYVFAMWIAFGAYAIYEGVTKYLKPKVAIPAVLAVTLLAAPVLLAAQNWDDHDRSGRYTAVSQARTLLDSCEKDAILFTIGDNDTFPLWYLQEIEGYRTDVKIVCTTLLPTDWHIDMVSRQTYDSAPVPTSFTHSKYVDGTRDFVLFQPTTNERLPIKDFIDFVKLEDERAKLELNSGQKVNYYPTNKIRVPVNRDAIIKNKVVAPQHYDSIVPYIDIDLPKNAIYKNTLIMLDIIAQNDWKRPIYFSGGSYSPEEYLWMMDYLKLDGMVYRLVPVKTTISDDSGLTDMGYIDSDEMYNKVMKWEWGNGGSLDIYHDPQTKRNSFNIRKNMARLAEVLIREGKNDKARKVMELAMKEMPVDYYGLYFLWEPFADGFYKIGDTKAARALLDKLVTKYREDLTYYQSLPAGDQNSSQMEIMRTIERYRSLLLIMKDNGDESYYNTAKTTFNRINAGFKRFNRENE